MWTTIASFVLRNRLPILILVGLLTIFMGWKAKDVRMSYKFGGLLPENDSTYIDYKHFLESFSEDGNVIVVGVGDDGLYSLENFNAWYNLAKKIKAIRVPIEVNGELTQVPAVDSVFSMAHCYRVVKDTSLQRFDVQKVFQSPPSSQSELDSLVASVRSMPFYEGLLFKNGSPSTLMMVFVNAPIFNSEDRGPSIDLIKKELAAFETETGLHTYVSGLPYIRTEMTGKVKSELGLFVALAALVTALLLLLFFRNIGVMLVSILVVGVGVVWSMGTIALFDYPISMLMALIPPLMIVIGVPNCIYLINKYHAEYRRHGNKTKALARVIYKVGNATFMTNATTALGFATFIFTHSDVMKEFGIIASINIIAVFFVSLFIIPTIYSYLPAPKERHTKHLDRKWVFIAVNKLIFLVTNRRKTVYVFASVIFILGLIGVSQMVTTGNVVDDLPQTDKVITDLRWFETEFKGVMPFEVILDTRRPGQVTRPNTLKKLEELQTLLAQYPEITKSLSIADAVKFCKQAFYGGDPEKYSLMSRQEQSFIGPYFRNDYETGGMEHMFFDSTRTRTRITAQIADIGTLEMGALMRDIRPKIEAIINPSALEIDSLIQVIQKSDDKKLATQNLLDAYPMLADSAAERLQLDCPEATVCLLNETENVKFIPALHSAAESIKQRVILTGTSVV
ncbi:MAG: Membrane transport protein mmpL8, partial [Bacteroidota bacterium]